MLSVNSKFKSTHFGSPAPRPPNQKMLWELKLLKDFWRTSATKAAWGCWLRPKEALVSTRACCLSEGWAAAFTPSGAWLERRWLRVWHAWSQDGGPLAGELGGSGKKVGKVSEDSDALQREPWRHLSSSSDFQKPSLPWTFILVFLRIIEVCFISELKAWGCVARSILPEFPPGAPYPTEAEAPIQ